jgi:hypothetical protein
MVTFLVVVVCEKTWLLKEKKAEKDSKINIDLPIINILWCDEKLVIMGYTNLRTWLPDCAGRDTGIPKDIAIRSRIHLGIH